MDRRLDHAKVKQMAKSLGVDESTINLRDLDNHLKELQSERDKELKPKKKRGRP